MSGRAPAAKAIVVSLVALLLAPSGLAYHLSAGAEDTVGLSRGEPPADTDEGLYERGTARDCSDGLEQDPSSATADGFCGALVYNANTSHATLSPTDQQNQRGVTIDLQMASYVGLYGISTCAPWCNSPQTYDAVHRVGSTVGLTPTADEVDDGGWQAYGGNVYAVSPMQVYSAAGQGWLLPVTDTSFVAFVTGSQGEAIDEERLTTEVDAAQQAGDLDERARAQVCVFTPEAKLGTHAADSGRCEVVLDWMGEDEAQDDPCQADAYVCGSLQPAWRGTTMCPMWHAACYLSDAWNSAHHFAVWHGVVAPSPPAGCAAAEPGFDTADTTFLAHDLDVYEPPSDATPAKGVPHAWDEASRNVPGLGPLREGRAPDVAETPAGREVTNTPAFAPHEPEPNDEDGWRGIDESSRERNATRSITECQTLATGEREEDPWLNVIDAHVTRDLAGFGVPAGASPEPDHEPRPSMRVTGRVGIFADVDDDGRHEQAPGSDVFEVQRYGAYPILWDHHAPGEGCSFRSGTTIGDLTTEAGYADPTGLAVTLRLSAGTLTDTRTGETRPIVEPAAFVLLSERLDPSDTRVADVIDRAAGDRPTRVLPDAFQPQCGEPTGGFTSAWEVQAQPMEGDGVIAASIVTVDGSLGGDGTAVPPSPIDLGTGTHVWWDVDPFQNGLEP